MKKTKKVIIGAMAFIVGLVTTNTWKMYTMPIEKLEKIELPSPPGIYTSKNDVTNLIKQYYPQLIEKNGVAEISHSDIGKELVQKLVLVANKSPQARLQVITTLADLLRDLDNDSDSCFIYSDFYWSCANIFGQLKAVEEIDYLIRGCSIH